MYLINIWKCSYHHWNKEKVQQMRFGNFKRIWQPLLQWSWALMMNTIHFIWCNLMKMVQSEYLSSFIRFQIQLFAYTFSGLVKNFNVCTHVKQITLWTQNWINRTQITTKMEKLKLDVICPKNMFVRPHVMHTLPTKWPYLF